MSRHFSIFSQIFQTTAPLIHGCPLHRTVNSGNHSGLNGEWIKHRQALTIYQYGPHPLLGDGILDHQFIWYLQDIHLQFSMNNGHMWSISLCSFYYVMILLLFWGHEPCIGFFLWRFKTPDTLICYPGSIEKLKLLGVIYLLLTFNAYGYLAICLEWDIFEAILEKVNDLPSDYYLASLQQIKSID
jgi:hypothetical protein